jgi:hypothetical protein
MGFNEGMTGKHYPKERLVASISPPAAGCIDWACQQHQPGAPR